MTIRAHYGAPELDQAAKTGLAAAALAVAVGLLVAHSPHVAVSAIVVFALVTFAVGARRWPVGELILVALILISGTVSWSRSVSLGPVSGHGAVTVGAAGLLVLAWLVARKSDGRLPIAVVLLAAFVLWSVASLAYHQSTSQGFQNILVWIAFVGAVATTMACVRARPEFSRRATLAVGAASAIAFGLYAASLAKGGLDSHAILDPRGFALFALIPIGCGLAWYRAGYAVGLVAAICGSLLILMSLSRLASAIAFVIWCIALAAPVNIRGWARCLVALGIAAALFIGAINTLSRCTIASIKGISPPSVESASTSKAARSSGGRPGTRFGRRRRWAMEPVRPTP